jgi:hypothetical protein
LPAASLPARIADRPFAHPTIAFPREPTMKRFFAIAFGLGLACFASSVAGQAPSITRLSTGAVTPGKATDVTIFGGNLAGPTAFWTSFGAKVELAGGVEKNGTLADRVVLRITTPGEAAVGVGALRFATGKGASNLRLMMVDDLPSVADNGNNRTFASAQEIKLPAAVDGTVEALASDYFKFAAKAGQRVSIEVVAQRLGSALDPMIRLLDAAGREIAFSDDEPGVGGDCRLAFEFAADGVYAVELRDMRNQGGDGHHFRLRMGNFPLVTTAFPSGAQIGSTTAFEAVGPMTAGAAAVTVAIPASAQSGVQSLGFKFPGGGGSGFCQVVVGSTPEFAEIEPNDDLSLATRVYLPCAMSGRFEKPRDRDYFQFAAKAGQRWTFAGRTRALGSPSDLLLRVLKADGGVLGEAEDAGANEGVANVTFPADGLYRLVVEDLHRRGGPEHAYRIEAAAYEPGFSLALEADKFDVPQEGSFVTKVTSARRDYNGPIELTLDGIDGVALEGNVIPQGKNETQLRATLPAGIKAGALHTIRVVGRAKIGDRSFSAAAGAAAALVKQMPTNPFPPASLDGALALGVGPVYPPFFELSVDGGKAQFSQAAGGGSFKVKLKRLDKNFKTPITVSVEGLPTGVAAEVKPVGKGEREYDVALKGPASLPESTQAIRIIGVGTHAGQTKRVVLEGVMLEVKK